jgi:hypothetical protein
LKDSTKLINEDNINLMGKLNADMINMDLSIKAIQDNSIIIERDFRLQLKKAED